MPILLNPKTLKEVADGFAKWLAEAVLGKPTAPEAVKPVFDMLGLWGTQGYPGDPTADSDYADKTEALIKDWAKTKGLELSLFMPGHSPLTPAEAPKEAASIIDRGLGLITVLNTLGIVAEAVSLGQMESVIWAMTNIINATGVPSICQDLYKTPVEIGVKIPLQRRMNSIYQPNIPDPRTLTSLRSRGMLSEPAYTWLMQEHGYPDWASEIMAYAETKMPGFSDQLTLLQRGFINSDTFTSWLRKSGLHPDTVEPLSQLRWQLPGYADIISIYMREGYLEEKWVEIPDEFITFMGQLGYSNDWATRLWGKHWVLPGVDHLYEMFHKKIIDSATMAQMLKYHDFEPVWRQRLIANAYSMIPRVDLRRAYRYKMIAREQLQERYEWLGFKSSDAEIMAGIAERTSLDRYYTRLETVARAAFRKGKLTESAFTSILTRINTPSEAVSITLETEKLARDAAVLEPAEEIRTLTASQVLSLYKERLFSKDVALTRLTGLGYSAPDATFLLSLSEPRPEAVETNRDLITAAAALYRQGLMSSEEFKGRLRKAGLSEGDVLARLEAEDLRYRLDFAADLIAMAKMAYQKDVYTADEFMSRLLFYGMDLERASALVALEELRKLPKPKVTA